MNLHGTDLFGEVVEKKHSSKLGDEFMIPPFTVLSAREGWWQDRKRAWLALGIQSELGRGESAAGDAAPGGSKMPAADYSKSGARGDGRGRAVEPTEPERTEKAAIVAGNGWGNGGPARRDAAFYAKKRKWEADNGREISTTEFRQKYWDGAE